MENKKNVKLLVLLLVVVLGAALAFGLVPKEDSQGRLYRVQNGYAPTDDLLPAFQIKKYTPTDDIMNRGGAREDLAIIPHIDAGYSQTDDFIPPPLGR